MKTLPVIYNRNFKKAFIKSYYEGVPVDPFKVIDQFFDAGSVQGYLSIMQKIYRRATINRCFKKRKPSNILYDYKLILSVLNAGWVINKSKTTFAEAKVLKGCSYHFFPTEPLENTILEKYLSAKEIESPYVGVKNIFNEFKLSTYHEELYDWMSMSLNYNQCIQEDDRIRLIYKHFCKLIICCWLIYNREIAEHVMVAVEHIEN